MAHKATHRETHKGLSVCVLYSVGVFFVEVGGEGGTFFLNRDIDLFIVSTKYRADRS